MTRPSRARPEIEADLAIVVTAPDGRTTTAHAVGEGSSLRIEVTDADVLLAAVDRGTVAPLADALDAAGVSVHVDGPRGRVATVGSAASSRVGRVLTGSANADVSPRAVLARARRPAVVAVAAALVILALRATRYRSR